MFLFFLVELNTKRFLIYPHFITKNYKMNKETKTQLIFFCAIAILLAVLLIPSFINPTYLSNDVQEYSILSENLIKSGSYTIFNEPHSLYPPGHPLLAIPFVFLFGKILGFQLVTFFWALIFLLLLFIFFMIKKTN